MMNPTLEYLAASEIGRTRPEASHAALQVIIENYSDDRRPFGKSVIYLSLDRGQNFRALNWKTTWSSAWKRLGRNWPAHDLQIARFDSNTLVVSYVENSYDGPVDQIASYSIRRDTWTL